MDEIVFDSRLDGSTLVLPVREQLIQRPRLEHITGEDVRTNLGSLFDDDDV